MKETRVFESDNVKKIEKDRRDGDTRIVEEKVFVNGILLSYKKIIFKPRKIMMRSKDKNNEKIIYIKGKYLRLIDRIEELKRYDVKAERDEQSGTIIIKSERTSFIVSKNSIRLKAYGIRFKLKSSSDLFENIEDDRKVIEDVLKIINKELSDIDKVFIKDSGKLWGTAIETFLSMSNNKLA